MPINLTVSLDCSRKPQYSEQALTIQSEHKTVQKQAEQRQVPNPQPWRYMATMQEAILFISSNYDLKYMIYIAANKKRPLRYS